MYLALHQHGDVYEHVVELLDAALQTHNVFVPRLDLIESLLRDPRVHDLQRAERSEGAGAHTHAGYLGLGTGDLGTWGPGDQIGRAHV